MKKVSYTFFIGKRYLKSRKKTGFINIITALSVLGVQIGVAALIIVLSIMNGFEEEVRTRIIGMDSHIRVQEKNSGVMSGYREVMGQLKKLPQLTGMAPYIEDKGMIGFQQRNAGVVIRGSDPQLLEQVSDVGKNMVWGTLDLNPVKQEDGREVPGVVLGWILADELRADLADLIHLISPMSMRSMFQSPPVKQFVVNGMFQTELYDYDNVYVFISLEAAQSLCRMGDNVSGLELRLKDYRKADRAAREIQSILGNAYEIRTWFQMKNTLYSAMKLEKIGMFIVLCLIILVAAFNIICTLLMMVMEKTPEIGILKSVGATAGGITRIFLYEGVFVGVIGTAVGMLAGFGLCWAQDTFHLVSIHGDISFIKALPIHMKVLDFVWIGTASLLICILSALYPARKAAALLPVDALRH